MDRRVGPERVEDGLGFTPDLVRVDAELVQEGLLVLEGGGAAGDGGGSDRSPEEGGGGGGGGGTDVEGHERDGGGRGARGLKRRRGDAALLDVVGSDGARVAAGGEYHRGDGEFLRHFEIGQLGWKIWGIWGRDRLGFSEFGVELSSEVGRSVERSKRLYLGGGVRAFLTFHR